LKHALGLRTGVRAQRQALMVAVFLVTYGAVFVAEIVGDKLLCTTGVLAMRYRTVPIFLGMMVAFMLKMAGAVLIGRAASSLPSVLVASITSFNLFLVAFAIWPKPDKKRREKDPSVPRAVMVSFTAIFFSEWGDLGQITAVTMAARSYWPLAVWLGAVSALVTKGALAASLGEWVRKWAVQRISPQAVRYAAVGLMLLLGLLSVIETFASAHRHLGA
jgi:putative Ca2+/H+ antiporter (TMEM165/GDT1 family)